METCSGNPYTQLLKAYRRLSIGCLSVTCPAGQQRKIKYTYRVPNQHLSARNVHRHRCSAIDTPGIPEICALWWCRYTGCRDKQSRTLWCWLTNCGIRWHMVNLALSSIQQPQERGDQRVRQPLSEAPSLAAPSSPNRASRYLYQIEPILDITTACLLSLQQLKRKQRRARREFHGQASNRQHS